MCTSTLAVKDKPKQLYRPILKQASLVARVNELLLLRRMDLRAFSRFPDTYFQSQQLAAFATVQQVKRTLANNVSEQLVST